MANIGVLSALLAGRAFPFFASRLIVSNIGDPPTDMLDITVEQGHVLLITDFTFSASTHFGINIFLNDRRLLENGNVAFFVAGAEIWLAPRAHFLTQVVNFGTSGGGISHALSGVKIPLDILQPKTLQGLQEVV